MAPTPYSKTFIIQNGFKEYDFKKCLDYIESQGKIFYGPSFKINTVDIPIIFKLLIYMIKDKGTALKENIDLNKGLLLSGPIGCGKTSLIQLIKPFASLSSDYKIKTCREISFDFAKNGFDRY